MSKKLQRGEVDALCATIAQAIEDFTTFNEDVADTDVLKILAVYAEVRRSGATHRQAVDATWKAVRR